jgi:transposase-like protein
MDCPTCGAGEVIQIEQKLPDDIELVFFACHRCEEKWWDRDGQTLGLKDVLDLARRSR